MSPKVFEIGTGPVVLTITGAGLQGAASVAVVPSDGITVGSKVVSSDGKSITVPLTIAANAPTTLRQVVVLAPSGLPYQVVKNNADQILITPPQPATIDSVEPVALQLGAAPVVMTLRGKNFNNAQSVTFVPSSGMTVTAPVVNASGTVLTFNASASADAASGPRAVVVTTPIGTSASAMTSANTVTLGTTITTTSPVMSPLVGIVVPVAVEQQQTVSMGPIVAPVVGIVMPSPAQQQQTATLGPIAAPVLGIVLQSPLQQSTVQEGPVASANLGIAVGAVGFDAQPKIFQAGSAGTLIIQGAGLQNTATVSIYPDQGVTVGTPLQISADGSQMTVPVMFAADAELTPRTVVISGSNGSISFAVPAASIISISPNSAP